ncbi:ABC transporter substrate-binding protein [Mycetocola saprophilus]|uniref:ABC transporter substrate-binding protein n=1 Tax=Mycetocola saprophilus TaxID=76636 RepID=UPI0005BD4D48|nr:ABC transporter substrate-binding protein [Mycetocola saprophilus]
MSRRTTLLALPALIAVSALALTGCSAPSDAAPVDGGSITYATGKDITCLDPHVGGDMPQATIAAQYLDSLVAQDDKGAIHPWLAKSWETSADGLTWTFHLRDDVKFTDGTPFDAAAVKANLDHMVNPATQSGTAGGYLRQYVKTDVENPTTAVVTLNKPYQAFLEVLAQPFLGIESPTALARPQAENCASPVGSGPFKIVGYTPQQEVKLVRNDGYNSPPPFAKNKGPAKIANITWKIIPENATRYGALRTGEADIIDFLPPENFAEAKADSTIALSLTDRPGNPTALQLNTTRAPFNDEAVRRAFLTASNTEASVKSAFLGTASYAGGPLSSVTRFYDKDYEKTYAFDLKKANDALDQAGWTERDSAGYRTKNGTRLTAVLPLTPTSWPAATVELLTQIQANEKKAGIEVKIENVDDATANKRGNTFDYDLRVGYWNTNTADVLRIVFSSAARESAGFVPNGAGYANPDLDSILDQALATTDDTTRGELYNKAQKIIDDAAISLSLYNQSTQLASRKDKVTNVVVEPSLKLPYLYDAQAVAK